MRTGAIANIMLDLISTMSINFVLLYQSLLKDIIVQIVSLIITLKESLILFRYGYFCNNQRHHFNQSISFFEVINSMLREDISIHSMEKFISSSFQSIVRSDFFEDITTIILIISLILVYFSISGIDYSELESNLNLLIKNDHTFSKRTQNAIENKNIPLFETQKEHRDIESKLPNRAEIALSFANEKAKNMALKSKQTVGSPYTFNQLQTQTLYNRKSKTISSCDEIVSIASGSTMELDDHRSELSESIKYDHLTGASTSIHITNIIRKSAKDPKCLIGWKIAVQNLGVGVVVGVKKRLGMASLFLIQFENGMEQFLSLKRSASKGDVSFIPMEFTTNTGSGVLQDRPSH